jgi:hypothetical protein
VILRNRSLLALLVAEVEHGSSNDFRGHGYAPAEGARATVAAASKIQEEPSHSL